jgi:hypothetical protein
MGIDNIHILIHEPQVHPQMNHAARQVQEIREARLIIEHREGQHTYGMMRRDCPLCVSGK